MIILKFVGVIVLFANVANGIVNCKAAFSSLDFDVFAFDKYGLYFQDDSKVILPQAGEYTGKEAIEEYIRFISHSSSPYIKEAEVIFSDLELKEVDENSTTCTFTSKLVRRAETEPEIAKESNIVSAAMLKIEYDYTAEYIRQMYVMYSLGFLELYFGTVLNTEKTRNYICDVSESCPDTNVGMSRSECVQKLEELPVFSSADGNIDGNDYGCRVLHASFASTNQGHCAHISFEPQEDPNGKIKCQHSKSWAEHDFFDQIDINDFQDFIQDERFFIESKDGYKILSMPNEELDGTTYVLVAVVGPVLLMLSVFLLVKRKQSPAHQDGTSKDSRSNPLLGNRAQKVRSTLLVIFLALLLANGAAGIIVWWAAEKFNWDTYKQPDNPLLDRYRGDAHVFTETGLQTQLSDSDFEIYTGFIVWLTCIISGFGLEVFVWREYLQEWTASHERAWRFAQFIFPLLAITSFGLSVQGNFLCLPLCVIGCWKCGFPETFMSLYLGLYSKSNPQRRLADFLDGIGTVLHHGAASMIISMVASGLVPSTSLFRYAANIILLLIMQHWIVLLQYMNEPLYGAVVLGIEWYFEWSVFSDMAQLYYLHWVVASSCVVMLFAHWIYLLAALTQVFDPEGCTLRQNVIVRGNALLFRDKSDPTNIDPTDFSKTSFDEESCLTGKDDIRKDSQRKLQQMKSANVETSSDDNFITSVEYFKRKDGKTVKRTRKKLKKVAGDPIGSTDFLFTKKNSDSRDNKDEAPVFEA